MHIKDCFKKTAAAMVFMIGILDFGHSEAVAVLLSFCICGFVFGVCVVLICSSPILLVPRWAVLHDCGVSWVSSLVFWGQRRLNITKLQMRHRFS